MFIAIFSVTGFVGLIISLVLCADLAVGKVEPKSKKALFFYVIFSVSISCELIAVSMALYEHHRITTSDYEKTNIGIGKIIRLSTSIGKYSHSTHTVVRLNDVDYNCYGYVPGAKTVAVIQHKRLYDGQCSYYCEAVD